jgi:peptidoglycan-associated lipoprotein
MVNTRNAGLVVFIFGTIALMGCATSNTTQPPAAQNQTAPAPEQKAAPASTPAPSDRVVHFAFDSSALDDTARKLIEAHGRYLAANPNVNVKLEGHADERGTRAYNLALGERRANSIANALRTMGVNGNRISVVSYGEDRPVATAHNEQAWAENRRGVIIQ